MTISQLIWVKKWELKKTAKFFRKLERKEKSEELFGSQSLKIKLTESQIKGQKNNFKNKLIRNAKF